MVNTRCCVPGCKNIFRKSSLLGFMRFPPEGELKNKWLNAIGRKASEITEESIMCCEHFSLSSYVVPGKVLRYNAVPTIFRNSNPLRKMPSEEKNQNCSSQGNVSRERLRPRILRSKPPQKIRSGEIKENSASQEDVAMERLRPHSPPLEVTILISEDEEMDEPETSEETDSRDLLYYPVMELEDEEEQEHSEASLELDSQRTHYQRLLQQVISAPDSLSNRPTFYRSRNNACIQVQMDRENPQLGMKKMRKRIKALNKRKRGLDKLLKNIYEVSALHEYKRLVEADYKQILGEPLEEISSADEPECQLEEHSYSQKTKQADPNSERQNETTAESTIPISVNDSTTPVNDSTTPVNDSTTPVNDSTTPVNAPQVPEKQAKDIIVQVMQRSTTQNESNHSES